MKIFILVTLTFFGNLSASLAQSLPRINVDGEIVFSDGSKTVSIKVGGDRDDARALNRRVRNLERAVRDLQYRVYELEAEPEVETERWFCEVTAFSDTFYGEGPTEVEARMDAKKKCEAANSAMFCKNIKCEKAK